MGATTFYLLELEKKQRSEQKEPELDYSDLTKAELFELCEENGIDVNKRATKAEIIALLEGE